MQSNAASLLSYHSWSAGGKTDAARCRLVQRGHTGLLFFLLIFRFLPDYTFISSSKEEAMTSTLFFLEAVLWAGEGHVIVQGGDLGSGLIL